MNDNEFRQDIRQFISENLPQEMAQRTLMSYHPHKPDVLYWTAKLHERGWSVPNWPVEYGGPGWTLRQLHIFEEECFLAGCPAISPQGLTLVGPVIYTYGTQEQKARFLPGIQTGEVFWAQGFSEPNAGSDLASLRTRAIRDGDHFIVNGQKIWTSEAHYSEWIFLLVRTSTQGKPQAGISFLLADLNTPGIDIRPIKSIDGGHVLNEVFLDDVRVPAENLIGEENMGWTYAKELLGAERTFSAEVPRLKGMLKRVKDIASTTRVRGLPLLREPGFARRLAELEIQILAQEVTLSRVIAEQEQEHTIDSPTASILKVRGTELVQQLGLLLVEALGEHGLPDYPEDQYLLSPPVDAPGIDMAWGVAADTLYRRSASIYGGTNEIQRNIIAAQLLRG